MTSPAASPSPAEVDEAARAVTAEKLAAEQAAAAAAAEQAAADQAAAEKAAAEQAAAEKAAAEQAAREAAEAEAARAEAIEAAGVELATVGAFTRVDPVTGGTDAGVGVVVQIGDGVLFVAPLAGHWVQVEPEHFQRLTADDLAG